MCLNDSYVMMKQSWLWLLPTFNREKKNQTGDKQTSGGRAAAAACTHSSSLINTSSNRPLVCRDRTLSGNHGKHTQRYGEKRSDWLDRSVGRERGDLLYL